MAFLVNLIISVEDKIKYIKYKSRRPSFDIHELLDGEFRPEQIWQTDKLFGSSIRSSRIVE